MKNSGRTAVSKLNNFIRHSRIARSVICLLTCLVVSIVTYAMIIPAFTMEYKANENELSLISNDIKLLGADEIVYSSDLTDFVTGMDVTDTQGNAIAANGDVLADTNYILTINFSESDLLQMKVNDSGVLTYTLPSSIKTPASTGNIVINGTTVIGTYVIDEDGNIEITPKRCDNTGATTDNYFIDNYENTKISLSFEAKVNNNGGLGVASIVLSDGVTVNLRVIEDGKLDVEKTLVNSDFENQTMDYEVTIKALNADVSNVMYYDTANESQYFIMDSMTILDNDGNDITSSFTEVTPVTDAGSPKTSSQTSKYSDPNQGFPSTQCSNFVASMTTGQVAFFVSGYNPARATTEMYANLGTIHAGETYTIRYSLPMSDYVMSSNAWIGMKNTAAATGVNTDGDTVTDKSAFSKTICFAFVRKSGMQRSDSNGNYMQWYATIGDGQTLLGSRTLTDILTSTNQTYITSRQIKITYTDYDDGTSKDLYVDWTDTEHVTLVTDESTGTQGFVLNLPIGDERASKYIVNYYTNYTLDGLSGTVSNTIYDSTYGMQASNTQNVTGVKPTVYKRGRISDNGECLHYEVTLTVPAGSTAFTDFHLEDYIQFLKGSVCSEDWYVDAEWKNIDITITGTTSGTTYNYTQYVSGDPTDTYNIVRSSESNNSKYYIYFNTANTENSKWTISEGCQVLIKYDVPIESKLIRGDGTSYVENTDFDALYLLENGVNERNWAYIYYSGYNSGANVDVKINTVKNGNVRSDGTVEYEVAFDPRRDSSNIYLSSAVKDSVRYLYVSSLVFIDDYDENLSYENGTLRIRVNDTDDSDYAIFDYTGSNEAAFDLNHKIVASATEFTLNTEETTNWMKDNTDGLTLLSQFITDYHMQYMGYTFTALYEMTLTDEAKQQVASSVSVDNTGYFTYNGWSAGMTNKAPETVSVDTGLMSKDFVRDGDKLDYTILLNPSRLDLLEDNERIKIVDTMSENLSVYWSSIKVYYQDASGNWIDMESSDSAYTCTKAYDSDNNAITFDVPDSQYLKFEYTTLITETGDVSISNIVSLVGYGDVAKVSEAQFAVAKSGGTASAGDLGFTLSKTNADGTVMLPDASFAIYIDVQNPDGKDDNPYSAPASVTYTFEDGTSQTLYYYKTYTTGEDGTVYIESKYFYDNQTCAVVEANAPDGYLTITDPIFFNFNPDAVERETELDEVSTMLSIADNHEGSLLPSTGGTGVYVYWAAGTVLIITGLAVIIRRRKKAVLQ